LKIIDMVIAVDPDKKPLSLNIFVAGETYISGYTPHSETSLTSF
jgi:hypothetical protein